MGWIFFIIAVFTQLLIVVGVVFFLLRRLNRELIDIALEKLFALHASDAVVPVGIKTYSALKPELQSEIIQLIKRKMPQALIEFTQNPALRGGIVIELPQHIIDLSVASRLKKLWS